MICRACGRGSAAKSLHSVVLEQHVISTRQQLSSYAEQKEKIERLVGKINGESTVPGRVPIHHAFESLSPPELMAHYQVADIAMSGATCLFSVNLQVWRLSWESRRFGSTRLTGWPWLTASMKPYYMVTGERHSRMQDLRATSCNYDWVQDFLQKAGIG